MNHPSLLIVVPTLDSYTLLPRLVQSLQAQTWPHWRLLFIDGPSSLEHRRWLSQCCTADTRCRLVLQSKTQPGIFGAMNHGFALAAPEDWLLFWGSDDWAASNDVLESVMSLIESSQPSPDLIVCHGRYANAHTSSLGRITTFKRLGLLKASSFRRALFFGSTPPHQATFFGPGSRSRLCSYSSSFRLSADLDYFLQISSHSDLLVHCIDTELVHMSEGGVSGQQMKRRLQEVRFAYWRSFRSIWFVPFLARYVRRLVSLISSWL